METTILAPSLLFTARPELALNSQLPVVFTLDLKVAPVYSTRTKDTVHSQNKTNEHERAEESSFRLPEIPAFVHPFISSFIVYQFISFIHFYFHLMSSSYVKLTAHGTADTKRSKTLSLLSRSSQMNQGLISK